MKGSYRSLSSVIKNLDEKQRAEFFDEIALIRSQITAADFVQLILFLQGAGGMDMKKQLLNATFRYVKRTLNAEIVENS